MIPNTHCIAHPWTEVVELLYGIACLAAYLGTSLIQSTLLVPTHDRNLLAFDKVFELLDRHGAHGWICAQQSRLGEASQQEVSNRNQQADSIEAYEGIARLFPGQY